jgi:mycofactocin system FadH/OYE family oxidoreductase 2
MFSELEGSIMIGQFKYLFSPLKIGRVTVPNRISFSAHLTNLAEHGLPTERQLYYWLERAKGGVGLIITEEQTVHPSDRAYDKLLEAYEPAIVPQYRKITQAIHEYETRVFAQLNHNGAQGDGTISRLPVWGPSPVADVLFREVPKVMEPEDIRELIQYFCRAAANVREGGFDGIELQLGHSSIIRQFLSGLSNQRNDDYGGCLENRMRLAMEVIEAVRHTVGPDFTLGVRLCADEMIQGGLILKDNQEIARKLEASGKIDFIDLSLATFYNLYLVGASMHTPLGYTIPLAAGIKKSVNLPVFCTGRINDPVMAEKVLAQGQADMIGMVRAQLCDPELANKAKEGRLEDIRYCIACNQGCYGRVGVNKSISCIQNPTASYEKERGIGSLKPASVKKRVVVIGSGPAGMRAANMAAARGHEVILFEKKNKMGGQVNIAALGAGRDEIASIIRNEENQLKKHQVKIVLNKEATAELVLAQDPDIVIVATGSVPKESPVAGANGPHIFNVWQVLQGEAELGNNILLVDYDGHHQASATAEYLAEKGKKVHMVTSSLFVGQELGGTQDMYLTRQRLLKKGVTFTPDYAVMEIKGLELNGFNVYSNEWYAIKGYNDIVLAMGNRVEDSLYFVLKKAIASSGKAIELYRIGDCVSPRKIDMAIWEGEKVGRAI